MDLKPPKSNSLDTFYFLLCPIHFKVDYSFAKNMKSGSSYRLVIYKGLLKVQEMSQVIKGKLVGGKILFEPIFLYFTVAFFTPAKNIEFTIKILETKPSEPEVEIAKHKIKSGDYIKMFSNDGIYYYKEDVGLLESFSLVFELFVHNSKSQVERIAKDRIGQDKNGGKYGNNTTRMHTPTKNAIPEDVISQSDVSDNYKDGATNSMKKLSRRRGHEGKLRIRNDGDNSDAGSSREGSVKSTKKPFGTHLTNERNDPIIKNNLFSNEDSSPLISQQIIAKNQNLVSVARRDSTASEILPAIPTKPVRVQSNLERTDIIKKDFYNAKFQNLSNDIPVIRQSFKYQQSTKSTQNGQQKTQTTSKKQLPTLNTKKQSFKAQKSTTKLEQLPHVPIMKCKMSLMGRDTPSQSIDNLPQQQARIQYQLTKDRLFYVLFFIISAFLFYNAVTPSRRV